LGLNRQSITAFALGAPVFQARLDIASWVADVSNRQFRWLYESTRSTDAVLVLTGETLHLWCEADSSPKSSTTPQWVIDALHRLGVTSAD
jgi:acyl-CoA thioesterase FadM